MYVYTHYKDHTVSTVYSVHSTGGIIMYGKIDNFHNNNWMSFSRMDGFLFQE